MPIESTIFVGVAIYMIVMIGVGLYASKKTHTAAEFMVAGRGLTTILCTTTIVATCVWRWHDDGSSRIGLSKRHAWRNRRPDRRGIGVVFGWFFLCAPVSPTKNYHRRRLYGIIGVEPRFKKMGSEYIFLNLGSTPIIRFLKPRFDPYSLLFFVLPDTACMVV